MRQTQTFLFLYAGKIDGVGMTGVRRCRTYGSFQGQRPAAHFQRRVGKPGRRQRARRAGGDV
ncbi:MAG: hypothetical protein R6U86_05030, partial [Bacteroidales bacterium]